MYDQYSEEIVTMDIFNLCRICMLNHKHLAYFNIFGKCMPNNDVKLSNALSELTNIKFCENDGLPARICSSCETRVIDAYMLKVQTERTNKKLLELIKPDKSESNANLSGNKLKFKDDTDLTGKTILKQIEKSSYIINYESDDIALVEVEHIDSDDPYTNHNIKLSNPLSDSTDVKLDITKQEDYYNSDNEQEQEIIYLDAAEFDGNDAIEINTDSSQTSVHHLEIAASDKAKSPKITSVKSRDGISNFNKIGSHINFESATSSNQMPKPLIRNKKKSKRKSEPLLKLSEYVDKKNQNDSNYSNNEQFNVDGQTFYIERNGLVITTECADNDNQKQLNTEDDQTYIMLDKNEENDNVDDEQIYVSPIENKKRKMKFDQVNIVEISEIPELQSNEDPIEIKPNLTKKKRASKIKRSPKTSPNYSERKHKCNVCTKKFAGRSNLVEHLRLHANIRMFQCPHCDKAFVQAGNLNVHLRIHTKERPYQCTMCPKNYNQSSALKIHIRSHTNERNYVCSRCPKRFTNGTDLNKHVRIHDDSLKTPCPYCDNLFTQKYNLHKHIMRVHSHSHSKSDTIKSENENDS